MVLNITHLLLLVILLAWTYCAWAAASSEYSTSNNATSRLNEQIREAGIDRDEAEGLRAALNFEISNWANGSVADEDFYRVPPSGLDAPAGALLKLQLDANTSAYTLPANTALSRILYQTETLNGTKVPASAFILWPYLARTVPNEDKYPVIGWAHGTSGVFGNCAPSHIRHLWYHFGAPYTLAMHGYVVVAPDYAGLGVDEDASGKPILHQFIANPALANDLFYSIQAAQSAFEGLSKKFVFMGHSQGGGAVWAAAERQAVRPVDGYLGAIAVAPVTRIVDLIENNGEGPFATGVAVYITRALSSIFPDFRPSEILTPAGLKRYSLLTQLQGCTSFATSLLSVANLVQSGWAEKFYTQSYFNLASAGGRIFSGPLLVLQGDADPLTPAAINEATVNQTCQLYPDSQLEYLNFANVTHGPILYASQRIWLDWIEDRFAGVETPQSCRRSSYKSARPYQYYQQELNWYIRFATQTYELN